MSRRRWILTASVFAFAAGLTAVAVSGASTGPRWIVFSAHPDGAGASQLFRVETTGTGLTQITTGGLPATAPSFSRDGTQIAFSRLGSGIFSVNVGKTGLRRLTSNGRDSYPAWSPDGKRIAFLRLYRTDWRLYTMFASGRGQQRLAQAPPAGRPSWTADGKAIFIPAAGDLVKVDAQDGHVLKYYGVALDIQTGQTATVSPDARRLAYVGPRISTGPPDCGEGRCPQFGLYLAGIPAPHRPRRIVNDTGAAGWSPDGKTLVYVSKGTLTLRAIASGAETRIATGSHTADGDAPPAWQPR
jgi:Tol biopolymer transport system component